MDCHGLPASAHGGNSPFSSLVAILRIVTVSKIRIQYMASVGTGSDSGEGAREVRGGRELLGAGCLSH